MAASPSTPRFRKRTLISALAVALLGIGLNASGAFAAGDPPPPPGNVIYDSTVTPLPGNLPSVGFEATSASELGDQVSFAGGQRLLSAVTVTMSSWACQAGTWNGGNCSTSPGATYPMPLTFTIYNVGAGNAVGSVLGTVTQTFNIPYRPSASPQCTGAQAGEWFDGPQGCFNGYASNVTFNLRSLALVLPNTVIWGISYNTSDYGASPYGDATACHSTSDGCFYDSLNVALSPKVKTGSEPVPGTAYQSSTWSGAYCDNGTGGTGSFRLDSPGNPCWAGYVPAAQFTAAPPPPPPGQPQLSSGNNGYPAPSNGAAKQVDEGIGGQGALLTSIDYGYGLVSIKGDPHDVFGDLTNLSTQYSLTQGTCGGGAPRWQIDLLPPNDNNMNDAVSLYVNFGTQPYGGCTGAGPYTESNIFDPSSGTEWAVGPGNPSFTTSQVEATYGAYRLLDAQVAMDGGWAQPAPNLQQVLLQNLTIGLDGTNTSFYPLPGSSH